MGRNRVTERGVSGSGVQPAIGANLFPGLLVVCNAGEPSAQLDGGRKLAFLFEDGADRGGL